MQRALERSYRTVPVRSLSEFRYRSGTVAVRCTRTGCSQCADFDANGRIAFEEQLGAIRIVEWNCDGDHQRDAALAAGVNDLPAYVIVDRDGSMHVREPSRFVG